MVGRHFWVAGETQLHLFSPSSKGWNTLPTIPANQTKCELDIDIKTLLYYYIPMGKQKYSNDEERLAAIRASKKKYYEKNKDKQLTWNMRYRHRVNPPKYVQEAEEIRQKIKVLELSHKRRLSVLQEHLERLESWVPAQVKT